MGRAATTAETKSAREMVGRRLRFAREYFGLTQAEVGRVLGITQSFVGKIENGIRPLQADMAIKLGRQFRISLDWMYLGELKFSMEPDFVDEILSWGKVLDIKELRADPRAVRASKIDTRT